MRRRCDRSFGLGPLFFRDEGAGGGAGDGAPAPGGSGGGAPAPKPEPDPKPTPDPKPEPDRSGMIPRERFDAVTAERDALKAAEETRTRKDLEAKGEHQKLAEQEKARADAAVAKALTIARRSAFIGAAAGNVADPEAAYKLAVADGLLDDLEVDDDGSAKDSKAPGKVVEAIIARYEFLKPSNGGRSFGGDRSGAGSGPEVDPSKMTSRDMLSAGYAQSSGRTRGS